MLTLKAGQSVDLTIVAGNVITVSTNYIVKVESIVSGYVTDIIDLLVGSELTANTKDYEPVTNIRLTAFNGDCSYDLSVDSAPIAAGLNIEVANFAALPAVGVSGRLYITSDTNKLYRWNGLSYSQTGGASSLVQNLTRAQVIVSVDFTNENIINVTDNLPAGNTVIPEPIMPTDVAEGDIFEFRFHKLLATQCNIVFPAESSVLTYTFNNGKFASIKFSWDATNSRLVTE